jgi:uncharacterized protein YlbG (UPF0298 family)
MIVRKEVMAQLVSYVSKEKVAQLVSKVERAQFLKKDETQLVGYVEVAQPFSYVVAQPFS